MVKKLKAIITTALVYEPNPENYDEGMSIEDMARVDLEGLNDDSSWVADDFNSETKLEVIVVED